MAFMALPRRFFSPPLRLWAQSGRPPARLPPGALGVAFCSVFPVFPLVSGQLVLGPSFDPSPDWLKPFFGAVEIYSDLKLAV